MSYFYRLSGRKAAAKGDEEDNYIDEVINRRTANALLRSSAVTVLIRPSVVSGFNIRHGEPVIKFRSRGLDA